MDLHHQNQKISENQSPEVPSPLAPDPPKKVKSEFHAEYESFFENCILSQEEVDQLYQQKLRNEGIRYNKNRYEPKLIVKLGKHNLNYRAVTLDITIGYFEFQVSVFFEENQSYAHYLKSISSRKQSRVFLMDRKQQKFAVKCFSIKDQSQPGQIFSSALKEYCLLKVACGLGIGPKIIKKSGFDIIFYSSCIQFSMEKCLELKQIFHQIEGQEIESGLKKKLKLLHFYQIAHLDIKTPNVMWSQQRQQIIFIDFGFSKTVKESRGEKSYTRFSGSVNFCSKQMLKAYSSKNEKIYVDLYFNDIHCLKKTLEEINDLGKYCDISDEEKENSCSDILLDFFDEFQINNEKLEKKFIEQNQILEMKYLIFQRNAQILNNTRQKKILLKNERIFIEFILQFPYYQTLNKIYKFLFDSSSKKNEAEMYNKIMESKKEKIIRPPFQNCPSTSKSNLFFFKKNQFPPEAKEIEYENYDQRIILIFQDNPKQMILNQEKSKYLSEDQFRLFFVKALDFRCPQSTLEQKITLCKVFIDKMKINKQKYNIVSSFPEIEICYRFIVDLYQVSQTYFEEKIVPNVLINMVIIEAFTSYELLQIIKKLVKKEMQTTKKSILLFESYFVIYWIQLKIYSEYSIHTMDDLLQIFIISFRKIASESSDLLPKILCRIILFSNKRISLSNQQINKIRGQLVRIDKVQSQLFERIMILTIFEKYNRILNKQSQILAELVIQICQISENFHTSGIVHEIAYIILSYFSFNIQAFKNIKKCLQSKQIIDRFEISYFFLESTSEQGKQIQFMEKLDHIINIFVRKQFIQVHLFLRWFNIILKNGCTPFSQKSQRQLSMAVEKISNVLNLTYLKKLEKQQYRETVLYVLNLELIVGIYIFLYPKNSRQVLDLKKIIHNNKNAMIKTKQFILLPEYLDFLKRIELSFCLHEERLEDGIKICSEQLITLLETEQNIQFQQPVQNYLGKMAYLIYFLNYRRKQRYLKMIHQFIHQYDLYRLIFWHNGMHIYNCLIYSSLVFQVDIKQYLYFQVKVVQFLRKYPLKDYVYQYMNKLGRFLLEYPENMASHANQIITTLFLSKQNLTNPYLSLLIAFFLDVFKKLTPKLQSKCLLFLSRNVDRITPFARHYVMQSLVQFVYRLQKNGRTDRCKRRIVTMFANYLKLPRQFSYYIKKLGLRETNVKNRRSFLGLKLIEKEKMFYTNLI